MTRPSPVLASGTLAAVFVAATIFSWQTRLPTQQNTLQNAKTGAALFVAKGCSSCHIGPETFSKFASAPSLAEVSLWAGTRRDGMTAEAYITESIENPAAFWSPAATNGNGPFAGMPILLVDKQEITSIVAYLLQG